jgi:hypothetical protein
MASLTVVELTTTISSLLVNFRNGVGIRTFCDIGLTVSFALEKYCFISNGSAFALCAFYFRPMKMIEQVFGWRNLFTTER